MKIRAVDACRPGSCHDAFIWNLSGARQFFLNQYEDGDRNSWLLGDSGYGLEPFLMTPYRDVSVGTKEHKFNKKHTLARNIIERTIGVLKSRFRCLQGILVYTPKKTIKIINVSCALHNICREYNIEIEEDDIPVTNEENPENDQNIVDIYPEINMYNVAKRIRNNIASQMN